MVLPKYPFLDFDEREITSLEIVFGRVKIFLCDFHREQAWHRWTSKTENGFSHISDQVKSRLRRSLCNTRRLPNFCKRFDVIGVFKSKRWCLAYRPNDLIICNTNNETERLNENIKYEELKVLKQSSLSEVLVILVNSFIPKYYKKYIEFNARFMVMVANDMLLAFPIF